MCTICDHAKVSNMLVADYWYMTLHVTINTLEPRQNARHFPHDIYTGILLKENTSVSLKMSLFVLRV